MILWDLADRQAPRPVGEPLTGQGTMREVAFSPDGATLAAAGGGDQVILWDLTRLNELRANALERACRAVGTGLSREEWASFVPGVPYEETCPR